MNKIMELAETMAVASLGREPGPLIDARHLLQAEVIRMEAELAAAKADIERYVRIASEQGAKLAALEGQEPVAEFNRHGVWHGFVNYLKHRGPLLKPGDKLYLAAGAKEQGCSGYGNHAPGDAPCNFCGFAGEKP